MQSQKNSIDKVGIVSSLFSFPMILGSPKVNESDIECVPKTNEKELNKAYQSNQLNQYIQEESWTSIDQSKRKEDYINTKTLAELIKDLSNVLQDNREMKKELINIKDEITQLKHVLSHEVSVFKTLNQELRNDIVEVNEREKNRFIRSGIPFRFSPHTSSSVVPNRSSNDLFGFGK